MPVQSGVEQERTLKYQSHLRDQGVVVPSWLPSYYIGTTILQYLAGGEELLGAGPVGGEQMQCCSKNGYLLLVQVCTASYNNYQTISTIVYSPTVHTVTYISIMPLLT